MEAGASLLEALQAGIGDLDTRQLCANSQQFDTFAAHWSGLGYLGLRFDFGPERLHCSHRESGFDFSIPYEQAADEELQRQLFTALRRCFGSFSDRHLGALFRPSMQISTMFAGFSGLLPLCRQIAAARR